MKNKQLFLYTMVLVYLSFAVSCDKQNYQLENPIHSTESSIISKEEALYLLSGFQCSGGGASTKSAPMTSIDDFDLLTLRVTKEDAPSVSDTSYHAYVINFENESGFAIIRADKHSEGVIAVSDDGSFDLNGNDDFLLQLIVNGITSDLSAETAVTKSGVNQVEPLLNAKWTQETSASGCWSVSYTHLRAHET